MAALLVFLALVCLCSTEKIIVMENGEFNFPLVVDEDIRFKKGVSTLYFTSLNYCVSGFDITLIGDDTRTVKIERISGRNIDGEYQWVTVSKSTISIETEGDLIPLDSSDGPNCASTWRLTVENAKSKIWSDISLVLDDAHHSIQEDRKRTITCLASENGTYSADCQGSSDGPLCLDTGICGCLTSKDCYSNTDLPFCDQQQCRRCTDYDQNPTDPNADHHWCKSRYPGYDSIPGNGAALPNERVAPSNYFREVCIRAPTTVSGACHRCNQAPLQPYDFPSLASRQGASGTYHCNLITPNAPICMDVVYFADANVSDLYSRDQRGSCVACKVDAQCARAIPEQPICNVQQGSCGGCVEDTDCNKLAGGVNCQADGSCRSCTSLADCGSKDGGPTPGQEICNTVTGLCGTCSGNSDCTGSSTGNNCQVGGVCKSCESNEDCGANDGGNIPGQTICYASTGLCQTACRINRDCESDIFVGKNCQADGVCRSCESDEDCGETDGGETPGQTQCDVEIGICVTPFRCANNSHCQGHGGDNCQADGNCVTCTEDTCGELDGGLVPGQPNCNINDGQCKDPCLSNAGCQGTVGANCGADGVCRNCTTSTDCRDNDGGELPGQSVCDAETHQCIACTEDPNNCPEDLPNCGADGICFACTAANRTCAGEGQNDKCDSLTGRCVDWECTEDEHCPTDCRSHCHKNRGCCVGCYVDAHCPGKNWRLDQALYLTCSVESYTCVQGCSVDADCKDLSNPACAPHSGCVQCVSDVHCGGDKPACSPSQGLCVGCMADAHCPAETPACQVSSQTCKACTANTHCPVGYHCNADSQCQNSGLSAGEIAGIVIGVIAGLILLGLLGILLYRTADGERRSLLTT